MHSYEARVIYKSREAGSGDSRRATARVPTPLHTAPALTMIRGESRSFRPHCKGGGGVEWGGDPCGRPGEGERIRDAACSAPFSTTLQRGQGESWPGRCKHPPPLRDPGCSRQDSSKNTYPCKPLWSPH